MPSYNDASVTYNSLIFYNGNDVPGVTPMWLHKRPLGGFVSSVGSLMCRCLPFFILTLLSISTTNSGKKS